MKRDTGDVTLSAFRRVAAPLLVQLACAHSGPAAPESPAPPSTEVTFQLEGGIAGRIQRLEVGPEGELTLWNRDVATGTGQLDAPTLDRLHSLVDSAAFRALLPRYVPENTCCDRYSYTVRVRRADGEQAVSTLDGAAWPPPLGEAIQLLNEARNQCQAPLR